MKERFKSGSDTWFLVHMFGFACIMIMGLLTSPIFGSLMTDQQIAKISLFWFVGMIIEIIVGLCGWVVDELSTSD